MTQEEQVVAKLQELGGCATLKRLYEVLDFSSWGTKTPFASVRRIVQNSRRCYKIYPGLWGLVEARSALERNLEVNDEKFSHAFYQGIVCQLGKMKNFTTFVPAQDQNKNFLDTPLKQVADTTSLPEFAFPNILKRAKTVDVIWFRKNQMPEAFYEIEHTTNIRNSVEKFCDLNDFYSRFYIIAPQTRKRMFNDILSAPIFTPMQERIKFFSYENLVRQFEAVTEISRLAETI